MTNYQNLEAWKISMQLVKEAYVLTAKFPPHEKYILIGQIRRAAISVPCNIAEGMGRKSKKDTLQFLHIARGSLYELETLINITSMLEVIPNKEVSKFLELIQQSLRVLNGFNNYMGKPINKT